jgi:hypothetical protein
MLNAQIYISELLDGKLPIFAALNRRAFEYWQQIEQAIGSRHHIREGLRKHHRGYRLNAPHAGTLPAGFLLQNGRVIPAELLEGRR